MIPALTATEIYTHATQRFSIAHPATWPPFEQPAGVIFIEPNNQAGYSLFFREVGETYEVAQLKQYLVSFISQNFATTEAGFSILSQTESDDGLVKAQFVAPDPLLGEALNEIRVWQVDTMVFVLLLSATQAQWQLSEEKFQALADTFTPLDTGSQEEQRDEEPVWVLIGPKSHQFSFFSPSDWDIIRQDEEAIVVMMPDTDLRFEVSVSTWDGPESPQKAAEKAALAYLETLSETYREVEHVTLAEFPLAERTATGATIDFLYTTEEGVRTAGSVITAAEEGHLYQIVFTAPAEYYAWALQWFNPMYQNFKMLSPQEFPQEQERDQ